MTHQETTFGELLAKLDGYSWTHFVYMSDPRSPDLDSACIIVDSDEAELGTDNFTPLIAEQLGLLEFLSIHDLQSVREYLGNLGIKDDRRKELFACRYYFERDAYPSKADLEAQ
ncbi:MAG: hypothetical protein AAF222_12420 [Pseudomonadota bacterium]